MGKVIGAGNETLVCAPVVGATRTAILEELEAVLGKKPDVVEWRADFFRGIAATDAVIDIAREMKKKAPEITMIFTIRSAREGGEPIPLSDRAAIELSAEVARQTDFEYVDCELSNTAEDIAYLREVAQRSGTRTIASYHNFDSTPDAEFIVDKLAEAERLGLDVGKVAVMPQGLEDVLTLLGATLRAKTRCKIPLITMSMGGYGALSRMVGGLFGSSLTFAVGVSSSAPGQVPIEDLRTVLEILGRSM